MSLFHNNILGGAAGAGEGPLYVEDVFSTYVWKGDQTTNRQITNDINLSGEGGLTWIKSRTSTDSHVWYDTERTSGYAIQSNTAGGELSSGDRLTFNSDGFDVGVDSYGYTNDLQDYLSWSWRKAPGFFDVVKYAGDGTATNQVAHNLGSTPGMIIVKKLDSNVADYGWYVWHRSLTTGNHLGLNSNVNQQGGSYFAEVTSTYFTPINNAALNALGSDYVAYFFAHDDAQFGENEDESIIKCGTYAGNGQANGPVIDLGWEPQWLMVKKIDGVGSAQFAVFDHIRGLTHLASNDAYIVPGQANIENTSNTYMSVLPNGFQPTGGDIYLHNRSGINYVYVAIRRPHKVPESGSEVFTVDNGGLNAAADSQQFESDHRVDMQIIKDKATNSYHVISDRLRGSGKPFLTALTNAESSSTTNGYFDTNEGTLTGTVASDATGSIGYLFKRAPKFFDMVGYSSSNVAQTLSHNLGVTPGLIIIKNRTTSSTNFIVWSSVLTNTSRNYLQLNTTADEALSSAVWGDTVPTSTQFTVGAFGDTNTTTGNYIAYLFASLDGVSKIGSYDGTGGSFNVDCGFTNGARFVLIKRFDVTSSGNWRIYDTARGIVAGNDPYLHLNTTDVEVTNNDGIDPYNQGFSITGSANFDINAPGGKYLFLAIA